MIPRFRLAAPLLGLLALWMPVPAGAERFLLDPEAGESLARFDSKAPLESFSGDTQRVSGYVDVDPEALGDSVDVMVEVDLASLTTGNPLRDKHMRENHLETDAFPTAVFRGGAVLDPSDRRLAGGKSLQFTLSGTFSIHGVERPLSVPVDAVLVATPEGRVLRAVARFDVTLSDYGIARPKFLVLRLDEVQKVRIEIRSRPLP